MGDNSKEGAEVDVWAQRRKWAKAKALKHQIPIGLALALIVALIWDTPGKEVSEPKVGDFRVVQTINVCVVFLISGVTLNTTELKDAMTAYSAIAYGIVAILFITACFGFLALELPVEPEEFRYGIALFCCVPTTLSSGVVLVKAAKGNGSLALLLTVASNLLGTISTPLMLGAVLNSADVSIDAVKLLIKLLITVLVPLSVGKALLQFVPQVAPFVKANKPNFTLASSCMIIMVVWQSFSRSMDSLKDQSFARIVVVIVSVAILHVAFLAVNLCAVKALRLGWPEAKAVIFMGSQKTLPVAMSVLAYLPEENVGAAGLVAIPVIVGHMSQLLMDAFIGTKWAAMADAEEEARKKEEEAAADKEAGAGGEVVAGGPPGQQA